MGGSIILATLGCINYLNHLERFASLIFALLGILILRSQPDHRIGWLCMAVGLSGAMSTVAWFYSACTAVNLPAKDIATWLNFTISMGWLTLTFMLLPMLFPNGEFLSPRWRLFAIVGCSLLGILTLLVATVPGPMVWNDMTMGGEALNNPLALPILPETIIAPLQTIQVLVLSALCLAGIGSIAQRYRRSQGVMRQQLKWLAYFLVVAFGTQIVVFELIGATIYPEIFETFAYTLIILLVFIGYPVVIGIAILRYRLYDIDIIIRRTLVYALVTGTLLLVYVGSIVLLQQLFITATGQESTIAIVISTLLIAVLFNPLRRRVQALIDRRFYRRTYDAESILTRFGAVARDEVNLETLKSELIDAVDQTVQPVRTSLWLKDRRS